MNEETFYMLKERLRVEEAREKELGRKLVSAQSDVRNFVLSLEESGRIVSDLRQILGQGAGAH